MTRSGKALSANAWVEALEDRKLLSAVPTVAYKDGFAFPQQLTIGPGGNVWFSLKETAKAGYITPAGKVTLFDTSSASKHGLDALTRGPDGNIWFAEFWDNVVGEISPAGKVTTYKLPNTYGPQSMALGADNHLWITTFNNFIGRISIVSGKANVTWFKHSGQGLHRIINYNGALYFAETSKIGRISTAGSISEFTLPQPGSVQDITRGPDGNLWFTENRANSSTANDFIGDLTPAGVVKEFPISKANGDLSGITAAGDGKLYFRQGDYLDAINTSGKLLLSQKLEFIAGGGSMVEDTTGNVWYAEGVLGKIGVASVVGSVTGTVFHDANKNGILNTGETGVANVRVYVDLNHDGKFDTGDVSTLTSSTGGYQFNLAAGTYAVRAVPPTGMHLTSAVSQAVTLALGKTVAGKNFGVA
jgi:hypothetical protein